MWPRRAERLVASGEQITKALPKMATKVSATELSST
jgi:hypothetical protein